MEQSANYVFGINKNKVVDFNQNDMKVKEVDKKLISHYALHDEFGNNPVRETQLAIMGDLPEFPTPIGIFRDDKKDVYDDLFHRQIASSIKKNGKGNLEDLLHSGDTWIVK